MSMLIITEGDKQKIRAGITLARAKPTPWPVLKKLIDAASMTPDSKLPFSEERAKLIDEVYREYPTQNFLLGQMRVAFNFECQEQYLFRHMSVSLDKPTTQLPNPEVVRMLCEEFGFSGWPPQGVARIWVEEFEPGRYAVNVMQMEEEDGVLRMGP